VWKRSIHLQFCSNRIPQKSFTLTVLVGIQSLSLRHFFIFCYAYRLVYWAMCSQISSFIKCLYMSNGSHLFFFWPFEPISYLEVNPFLFHSLASQFVLLPETPWSQSLKNHSPHFKRKNHLVCQTCFVVFTFHFSLNFLLHYPNFVHYNGFFFLI